MKDEEFYKSLGSALRQEREKRNLSHHSGQKRTPLILLNHVAVSIRLY